MVQRLVDKSHPVIGLAPITPSTSTPDYVSLENYSHFTAIISVDNGTTVTGSAITLHQATAVAGTGEKALSFTTVFESLDTATTDVLTETAVVSDTFTTQIVDDQNSIYVIEIEASCLDTNNEFDCIRVGTGDGVATVLSVLYVMGNPSYNQQPQLSATVD